MPKRVRCLLTFDRGPLRRLRAEAKRKKIAMTELVRQIIKTYHVEQDKDVAQ